MIGPVVVVDSSVVVAILRDEEDAQEFIRRAMIYQRRVMSTATWLESSMVCESKKPRGGEFFDRIVASLKLELLPFTVEQARLARDAFKRYGKGRQAKASLSFGDCFAYALAKDLGAPLLFKGNDFSQTDIPAA